MSLQSFFKELKKSPEDFPVFNPWWDVDPENDLSEASPVIRRKQLKAYLDERIPKAKIVLLGEALGYQGGHFSGMAMTSERILLGHLENRGITPDLIFNMEPKRTSREDVREKGFTEPTATIVWSYMVDRGFDSRDFIIWNAYPWHPYKKEKGFLSNRTPSPQELGLGIPALRHLLKSLDNPTVVAIGEKAYTQLSDLGIECQKVRHPANGGAGKFRSQMDDIVAKLN